MYCADFLLKFGHSALLEVKMLSLSLRSCLSLLITFSLSTVSIDPSVGKVDKSSLSQHTLLELLVEGFENTTRVLGENGAPDDIFEWKNVELNDTAEIIKIDWTMKELGGSLLVQWLPETIATLNLVGGKIAGTLDWASLPRSLVFLNVRANHFNGSLHVDKLPQLMEHFDASWNDLSGEVALRKLPEKLIFLDISYNKLTGPLDITALPDRLEELYLNENSFSGEVCLKNLPESLFELWMQHNTLSGTLNLTSLPKQLYRLCLSYNAFDGATDFSSLPNSLNYLEIAFLNISGEIIIPNGGDEGNDTFYAEVQGTPQVIVHRE